MKSLDFGRCALGICVAAIVAGCGGSQPPIGALGAMPHSALTMHAERGGSVPFLYVASLKVSKYAFGSSKPLRSTPIDYYVLQAQLALDGHGHLCESSGNESAEQLLEYDARTLKLLNAVSGTGAFFSLVADRFGYLYASAADIEVYAPGCTQLVNVIHRGLNGESVGPLVFDSSGNLYAGQSYQLNVYAPTQTPGHMKFVRHIRHGIHNSFALAFGPSGDLFVVNYGRQGPYVAVYAPGSSAPTRTITEGLNSPWALAIDSTGRLYVANAPEQHVRARGSISIYAPSGVQPIGKITAGIDRPLSLALDPANNLYVANGLNNTVTVYGAKDAKLMRTIRRGIRYPQNVLIGSP
jgi:DNA-binding beta-propeller fold protein YncE